MNELHNPIYDADKDHNISLTSEQQAEILKRIQEGSTSLAYLHARVKANNLKASDACTALSLLRFLFNDLNEMTDAGQFITQKLDETAAMLRQANERIRELQLVNATQVSASIIESGIDFYHRVFEAWAYRTGFRYVSIEPKMRALLVSFDNELHHNKGDGRETSNNALKTYCNGNMPEIPYLFGENTEYDLYRDAYHDELLDTDKNKQLFETLLTETFPKSAICSYKSIPDRKLLLLQPKAVIPYTAIEAWLKKIKSDESDEPGDPS